MGNLSDILSCPQYLVDGKSNGEESGSLMTLHPSTFLHQSHNESAGHVPVLWVVILFVQLQPILRVRPERFCKTQEVKTERFAKFWLLEEYKLQ